MIREDFYLGTYLCLNYSEKISNRFLQTYLCLKYSEGISNSSLGQETSKL